MSAVTSERTARGRLDGAIADVTLGGGRVPCVARPGVFDPDHPDYNYTKAQRGCLWSCPVIALCHAWVETSPDVTGIVAGFLHDPHRSQPDPDPEPVVWLPVPEKRGADPVYEQAALDFDGLGGAA
ncbi:MAG: hypothetical protein ACRCYU_22985 [Nocardioides sp.]